MNYKQAEKFFGSQGALAQAFQPPAAQSSVCEWKQRGSIPRGRQFELHVITAGLPGALTVDRKYLRKPPMRARSES